MSRRCLSFLWGLKVGLSVTRMTLQWRVCCLDAISESNPRVIHEDRARKLAAELKRCTYYETCATYGLNVERVFHDGLSESFVVTERSFFSSVCHKVVQQRYGFSSHRSLTPQQQPQSPMSTQYRFLSNSQSVPSASYIPGALSLTQTAPASVLSNYRYDGSTLLASPTPNLSLGQVFQTPTNNGVLKDRNRTLKDPVGSKLSTLNETQTLPGQQQQQERFDANEQITPTSTPTQKRKETKRKSNIFTVSWQILFERELEDRSLV